MTDAVDYAANKIIEWRKSPLLFVQEALGARPTKQQQAVLKAIAEPGAHIAIRSGHGVGKSVLMSWTTLWGLICYGNDVKIPVTAPTAHQLEDVIWPEIKNWRKRLPSPWCDDLEVRDDKVYFKDCAGFAALRTGRKDKPEALQGFHAKVLIFIIDEASGIDDIIFDTARGALSTKGARILMAANPTRTSGYFYNAFHTNRAMWKRYQFSCLDSPLVTRAYVHEIAEEYGEKSDMYRVRVLGDFPHVSDMQFMPSDIVEAAYGRTLREDEYNFAPKILGVDVARFGQDKSVIFLRQGLMSQIVWEKQGADTVQVANAVANAEDTYKTQVTGVDATGIGAGVIDFLRNIGREPIEVQFAGASSLSNCLNKRAEMWWKMRDWLKGGGCVPDKQALKDDFLGPMYSFNTKGLLQLERKEDMKKRGLASPDYADALAITFAASIEYQRETTDEYSDRQSARFTDDDDYQWR